MTYFAYSIDYTGGLNAATIDRATIDGHQIGFVCRYLSGFSKDLTPSEAKALSDAGLSIIVVFETTAAEAENGHAAGVHDAQAALVEAKRCGMPDGRPIYMAVDEDTTVGPRITAYFQGVASVLGLARTGAYGGYKVIKGLFDASLIRWGWQTYAWSGGAWDSRAHIQQYSNDHTLSGAGVDYDRAIKADYGQWRVGVTPTPTPQEETEMIPCKVEKGLDSKTEFPFLPGKFGAVYFFADNSYTDGKQVKATVPVTLRYALHRTDGTWQTGTVTVGRGAKDTKTLVEPVKFTDAAHTDAVSVTRVDGDGTESVSFTVA